MKEYFIQLIKLCGFCCVIWGFSELVVIKIEHSTKEGKFAVEHKTHMYTNTLDVTLHEGYRK